MKNEINNIILLVFITCLALPSLNEIYAQQNNKYGQLSYNNAVNASGKQRLFTQKMSKAYLYLISNSSDSQANKDLLSCQVIFEEQNRILLENTTFKGTIDKIKMVNKLWKEFRNIIKTKPNFEGAKEIIDTNTDLLKAANDVVLSIILESKNSKQSMMNDLNEEEGAIKHRQELEELINISGRQRMLTQRLAFYYFANQITLKNKNTEQMLENVFNEIGGALNVLLMSSFNTPKIDEKMGLAISKWNAIKNNKEKLLNQGFGYQEIYQTTNSLTTIFNQITNLYEKIEL